MIGYFSHEYFKTDFEGFGVWLKYEFCIASTRFILTLINQSSFQDMNQEDDEKSFKISYTIHDGEEKIQKKEKKNHLMVERIIHNDHKN